MYYPPPYYMPPQQLPPRVIPWNEGEEIPLGYHKGTEARVALIVSGSVLFGTAWLPSAIVGTFSSPLLAIPLAGPLAVIPGSRVEGAITFWLVFDTIQQVGGLAMFIAGFAAPRTVLLRSDVKSATTWWLPTPMSLGKGGAGLGIQGTM